MSLGIKKGDKVVVISGKDRGKAGKVLKVIGKEGRVIVESINLFKKHIRRRSESEPGGIKEIPRPINISNLALFCPNCSKNVKFKIDVLKDKSKVRICKKCNRQI